MKKIKLYLFSLSCLALLILSNSTSFMKWWADFRIQKLHSPFTRARYGDLYSGCFLPQFIDTSFHKKLTEYRVKQSPRHLYILHDSYLTFPLKKENFVGVDSLIKIDFRNEGKAFKLNKKKQNILIIESTERGLDWRFTDTAYAFSKLYPKNAVSDARKTITPPDHFLNSMISQNLEFNLFDYEFLRPVKELKAVINFSLFEKTFTDVALSYDKKYLFLGETVSRTLPESSFRRVSNEEILFIADRMNAIARHFEKLGFDKVYFAIIPNPVSILEPWRMPYNYKVERIRDNPSIRCGIIDVCYSFSHCKKQIYRRDDSHWNENGLQLWVNEVNSKFLFY